MRKHTSKIIALAIVASLCTTTLGFAIEKDTKKVETKKLITLDTATKIALEKNIDIKTYDAQKEKIQANIDGYFNNIRRDEIYYPGAETIKAKLNYGGGQAFLARDKVERGMILKKEVIKSSVENLFATISKLRRELLTLEQKYNSELSQYKKDVKKQELGTMSKMVLEEKRLALLELGSSIEDKKTDLTIAYSELNKLLKLPNFEDYTIDNYSVEYEVLDWSDEKVERHIKQVPDYDMNVLNKKGEAEFSRNEFQGILAINDGNDPYASLKSDIYIADFTASQLAEESMIAAKDKYNNMKQLEAGINTTEQSLKTLKLQLANLEARYNLGQISKSEVDKLKTTINDTENSIKAQKDTYMNLRRMFENKFLAGLK